MYQWLGLWFYFLNEVCLLLVSLPNNFQTEGGRTEGEKEREREGDHEECIQILLPLTNITLYIVHLAAWNVKNLWNTVSCFLGFGVGWWGGEVCVPQGDDRQIDAKIWSCVLCMSEPLWSTLAF